MAVKKHQGSVLDDAQKYMGWGLGGVVGAGVTFALYTFGWVFLGGPLQEWFEEKALDPHRDRDEAIAKTNQNSDGAVAAMDKKYVAPGYRILVSDLHIDTWAEQHPEREAAFIDFLRCVRQTPQVTEIYLNGDLLDLPLHPIHQGKEEPVTLEIEEDLKIALCRNAAHKKAVPEPEEEKWQGVLPKQLDAIFAALRDATGHDREPPLHAYYFTGNHDIGISGLRYFRPDLLGLPAQAIWNPSAFILGPRVKSKDNKRQAVYIEHGHLHDPLLWLYLRYSVFDLLRGGTQSRERNLLKGFQRGGKSGMAAPLASEADQAMLLSEGAPATALNLAAILHKVRRFGEDIVRYRYRHAARRARRRLSTRRPDLDITTVIFGHTHLRDEHAFPTGWKYINAESWDGKTDDQTYWIIKPDGAVTGPHQWEQNGYLDLS